MPAKQKHAITNAVKLPVGVRRIRTLSCMSMVGRIAFSPDGRYLATPTRAGKVHLWDIETGKHVRAIKAHTNRAICLAFDPKGRILVTGGSSGEVKLWEAESGREVGSRPNPQGAVYTIAFDPQRSVFASGSFSGMVVLSDIKSTNANCTLVLRQQEAFSIAFSPEGGTLAIGGLQGDLKLWNTSHYLYPNPFEGPQDIRLLKGGYGAIYSVAFDNQGKTIATGGADGRVRLWKSVSGVLFQTLEGHTASITSVAFRSDGRFLASRGMDSSVRLWNCETGACVAAINGPVSSSWNPGLAFHPTRPWLASVGTHPNAPADPPNSKRTYRDTCVHIWEFEYDALLTSIQTSVVSYTSAKVVLVGESNVGKSYLAHRIGTNSAPKAGTIPSTHGMRFWPMAAEKLGVGENTPHGQKRDVVFWDMGGQEEYRLIHQLFLHDTTVALVLFDPSRGSAEFQNVETWNKYLERQLEARPAVKLLVGAKMDSPSNTVNRQRLEQLIEECGFAGYYETSSLNGRGVPELCAAIARAIDWEILGKTSRPELFQRIRDLIEDHRKRGEVVLHIHDLHRELNEGTPTSEEENAVNAVADQLAAQGVIARSRLSTGEPALVLQVSEVERYGGSLIVAARANPRGVPALEIAKIPRPDFTLPGIEGKERLPRAQELPVLECTVRLLVEHGICFEHQGLLIFPTCFGSLSPSSKGTPAQSASLYYDFSGAIDNIYASLIAWLVLARDFGRVRLWADRAEFEVGDKGLCGLQKVSRPGGFARLDVYFELETVESKRKMFIDFVEQHLEERGVEITERIVVPCPKGFVFDEETLRLRIAEGFKDVMCPRCEERHGLAEDAATIRQSDVRIKERTWALKTQIEERRKVSAVEAVKAMEHSALATNLSGPIRMLHLSDLHFTSETSVKAQLQWLLDDLRQGEGWGGTKVRRVDYLVISGDFTDRGKAAGFEKAYEFISALTSEFRLSAERCIFVPGNHDVTHSRRDYEWRESTDGLRNGDWVQQGDVVLARNDEFYPLRFKPFSDAFFHKFFQKPFPMQYGDQGIAVPFWENGIQFIALNSCWNIDRFFPKRSSIFAEAVANVLREAEKQEKNARDQGNLSGKLLRIAVWHHSVSGPEQIKDTGFLSHLQNHSVKLALHGDVHELRRDLVGYWQPKRLYVVGAGSFGASREDRPEATPRLYNLLKISRELTSVRIHTRCQARPDGSWRGWNEWPNPQGEGALAYYTIDLREEEGSKREGRAERKYE